MHKTSIYAVRSKHFIFTNSHLIFFGQSGSRQRPLSTNKTKKEEVFRFDQSRFLRDIGVVFWRLWKFVSCAFPQHREERPRREQICFTSTQCILQVRAKQYNVWSGREATKRGEQNRREQNAAAAAAVPGARRPGGGRTKIDGVKNMKPCFLSC